MHAYFTSTLFQRTVVFAVAAIGGAWWLAVPGVMTSSTFVAIFGIVAASAWVLKSTVENARPASSLAQSLHDVETAAALKHDRRGLNR
jgi:hypothetical protein